MANEVEALTAVATRDSDGDTQMRTSEPMAASDAADQAELQDQQDSNAEEAESAKSPSNGNPTVSYPPPPPPPSHFYRTLPPGWSEHVAPGGQTYWYNAATGKSTWQHPATLAPQPPLHPPPHLVRPMDYEQPGQAPGQHPVLTKEKPSKRRKIPGTNWQLITTNHGNQFYFLPKTRTSVWQVPEEIADLVQAMFQGKRSKAPKRALEEEPSKDAKRKKSVEHQEPAQEVALDPSKKTTVEEEQEAEVTEMTEEDIAWQLQQLQEEGSAMEDQNGSERDDEKKEEERKEPEMPDDERYEQFMAMLSEKSINPLAPWERELPKFISDPRYNLVKSLPKRKEIFEQFCKVLLEEKRAGRNDLVQASTKSLIEEYKKLFEEPDVTHRTRWEDFRFKYRKDPRFLNLDDPKLREQLFREHSEWLKRKREEGRKPDPRKAKKDFWQLLEETPGLRPDSSWRKTKREIYEDPRYQAVDRSERREDIFRECLGMLAEKEEEERRRRRRDDHDDRDDRRDPDRDLHHRVRNRDDLLHDRRDGHLDKASRAEASLREREQHVQRERMRIGREKDHSRNAAMREEAIVSFRTLLIDTVRSHKDKYDHKVSDLERDYRFNISYLDETDKRELFAEHTDSIYQKRLKVYENMIDETAKLNTPWTELLPLTDEDVRATRLSDDKEELERLFRKHQKRRYERALQDFRDMLAENQFVEFRIRWADAAVGGHGSDDDMDNSETKKPTREAKREEIEEVLKGDTRYLDLDPYPEIRQKLIDEYLHELEDRKPEQSVHV
ncbi:hypothetical protein BZG36_01228 [Bifiguratus adelaidae]|uniref:WW domain-containing protein n=1 Tax=Bifiguratus adelaidae TaxID=1938954 RepID=A0A261Y5P4_9FUNG|nr:hypothetical protein BZG36_01228 [Bifiguratus adelaidae]